MVVHLDGGIQPTSLGPAYSIRAPGFEGTVDVHDASRGATRSTTGGVPGLLDDVVAREGFTELDTINLQLTPARGSAGSGVTRQATGPPSLELDMNDLGPTVGQVVLSVDEHGVATWHHPSPSSPDGTRRFEIRVPPPAQPAPGAPQHRGLVGLGMHLLKTYVYKLSDPVIGAVSDGFTTRWEAEKRPTGLRTVEPGGVTTGAPMDVEQLRSFGDGRALLLIHGTFSTTASGFASVPDDLLRHLHQQYDGRVFAFDHPTLSVDPVENADALMALLPPDVSYDVDVIAHSRGGLVARALAGEHHRLDVDTKRLRLGRVVFAGTPNRGTVLVHPDHLTDLIDRYTTLLNLFPLGPVGEALDSVVTVVKMLGRGFLTGLDGLTAMRPESDFLDGYDHKRRSDTMYFGLAADYEPGDPGLAEFLKNQAMGLVFSETSNDLVVPTDAVSPAFGEVSELHRFDITDSVHHSGYFAESKTVDLIATWLTG